jgi:alkaline phosphatase
MILCQTEEASKTLLKCLQYAIDRKAEDLTLAQITEAGIKTLASQRKDGFFLMIEGGKIDWACHSNDAATTFHEIIDMDQAIKVAYEFYKQHPDETLIVVTADHETGGIALGRGPYELHTDVFQHQKISVDMYSSHLEELIKSQGTAITWDIIEADLKANWGFWDKVQLNDHQTARLKRAFDKVVAGKENGEQSLYSQLGGIATEARNILHEIALVGWQSGGHSNGFVPVFAIGAGAEEFVGKYDNTEIPKRIGKVTGWKK